MQDSNHLIDISNLSKYKKRRQFYFFTIYDDLVAFDKKKKCIYRLNNIDEKIRKKYDKKEDILISIFLFVIIPFIFIILPHTKESRFNSHFEYLNNQLINKILPLSIDNAVLISIILVILFLFYLYILFSYGCPRSLANCYTQLEIIQLDKTDIKKEKLLTLKTIAFYIVMAVIILIISFLCLPKGADKLYPSRWLMSTFLFTLSMAYLMTIFIYDRSFAKLYYLFILSIYIK